MPASELQIRLTSWTSTGLWQSEHLQERFPRRNQYRQCGPGSGPATRKHNLMAGGRSDIQSGFLSLNDSGNNHQLQLSNRGSSDTGNQQ